MRGQIDDLKSAAIAAGMLTAVGKAAYDCIAAVFIGGTAVRSESSCLADVSDALLDGQRLRALIVVDAFTREALAIDVDQGTKGLAGWSGR